MNTAVIKQVILGSSALASQDDPIRTLRDLGIAANYYYVQCMVGEGLLQDIRESDSKYYQALRRRVSRVRTKEGLQRICSDIIKYKLN